MLLLINLHSKDIKQQKLDELKNIFPEIFADEIINYDKLKEILSSEIEESKSEHYSFNWSGKKGCYKTIKTKTTTTLKVDTSHSELDSESNNVFIEGDNLEVLKLLQNAYHKKIKMIYIDPPYNKDKDFVYKDTWGDTITNYMIQTDQLREEGYTSTKTSFTGRRHTNWLNMIYPRLWLSRNLLKDDGVIFVSIDDDEVHNLRKVMDEIYGEENFVAQIVWEKKTGSSDAKTIAIITEYVLIYVKSIEYSLKIFEKNKKSFDIERYKLSDKHINERGPYYLDNLDRGGLQYSDSLNFNITAPDGTFIFPNGRSEYKNDGWIWKWSEKKVKWGFANNFLEIKTSKYKKNGFGVYYKNYLYVDNECQKIERSAPIKNLILGVKNSDGSSDIKSLFEERIFQYTKPVEYMKYLINFVSNKNEIILDFFAGSGTTAHAVMDLNKEDGGNRKYILVQLPEATDEKSEAYKAGYKKISDITKERIKRVIKKLDYKDGFKSFRLDNSNFQMFKEVKKRPNESLESIEKMLKMSMFHENILTQGAKELDLVYEVGLKNGFTLSAICKEFKNDKYNFITLNENEREFYFCFDKEISNDIVHVVPKDAKLICYEKALGDSVKLNLHTNLDLETL